MAYTRTHEDNPTSFPHQYGLISLGCTHHVILLKNDGCILSLLGIQSLMSKWNSFLLRGPYPQDFWPSTKRGKGKRECSFKFHWSLAFCLWSHHRKILCRNLPATVQSKICSSPPVPWITVHNYRESSRHQVKLFCFMEADSKRSINLSLVVEQKHQMNSKDHSANSGHWPLPKTMPYRF